MMRFALPRVRRAAVAALASAALLGALAAPTTAQPPAAPPAPPPVTLAVQAEKLVVAADGSAGLAAATSVEPGDTLLYTVSFTNATAGALDHVRITQAIPPGVAYVADTAVAPGAVVLYSVDGGATFGLPAELTVADGNGGGDGNANGDDGDGEGAGAGAGARRAAAAADYTHVRWLLEAPLAPGATGFARFRAELR